MYGINNLLSNEGRLFLRMEDWGSKILSFYFQFRSCKRKKEVLYLVKVKEVVGSHSAIYRRPDKTFTVGFYITKKFIFMATDNRQNQDKFPCLR